jgi:heme exporter protein B
MIYPLLFLLITVLLFPLSINADPELIKKMAAGIFWVAVLFLLALTLEQLFREDCQEGVIEQLILSPYGLLRSVVIKQFVFCLVVGVPLTVMTPFLSMALYIPWIALKTLLLSICLGIPTLVALGSIARVLTLGLRQGGLLIVLLVMPFYIPVLIFASSAVTLASVGLAPQAALAWLSVLMIFSVSFAPFIVAGILRLGLFVS